MEKSRHDRIQQIQTPPMSALPNYHSYTDTYREQEHEQRLEDPKERWRRHLRYTISIRDEKNVVKRFFVNLKVFILESWFDILTVLITVAVAAAVGRSYSMKASFAIPQY